MSNPMPLAHSSSSVIPGSNNDQRYGTTYWEKEGKWEDILLFTKKMFLLLIMWVQ
jgi:hypothetical protein